MKTTQNNSPFDEALKVVVGHIVKDVSKQVIDSLNLELSQLKPIAPAQEDFINIKEASEYLDNSVQTIYRLVSQDEIPYYKTGKKLYFLKSELRNWVIKGGKSSTKPIASKFQLDADTFLYKNKIKHIS